MNKVKNILVLLTRMEILVSVTEFRSVGFIPDHLTGRIVLHDSNRAALFIFDWKIVKFSCSTEITFENAGHFVT